MRRKSIKIKPTKGSKPRKSKVPINHIEGVMMEWVYIEKREAPLRFYFKRLGNQLSVYYRPTHQYMLSLAWDEEGKKKLKELIFMRRDAFYKLLVSSNVRLPEKVLSMGNSLNPLFKEQEEWLAEAWMIQTESTLTELGIAKDLLLEEILYSV